MDGLRICPSHLDGFMLNTDYVGPKIYQAPQNGWFDAHKSTHLPNMDGQILERLDPYHFRFEVAGRVRSAAIQSDQSVQAGNKWNVNVVVTTWMSQSVSRSGSDALAFPHQCQIESNLNNRSQVLSSIISSPVPSLLCEFVQEWGTYRCCTYPQKPSGFYKTSFFPLFNGLVYIEMSTMFGHTHSLGQLSKTYALL